ncbi:hypothetical protein [Devosia sp.]|uniref:COG4223 family protein n=1 Tax=Devosia sp. TaxID=1871048 RepID=UPI002AFFD29C|nr:hypothetical protein [Devosia sp.]
MAESKGSDGKPGETRSGPVKPPVLDLTARAGGPEAPGAKPGEEPKAKPAPTAPSPAARVGPSGGRAGLAIGAALGGGVLGLAAAYGLAWFGFWPTTPASVPPADPRLAQFATAIPELESSAQGLRSELAALTQRLQALEAAEPVSSAQGGDAEALAAVRGDVAALAAVRGDVAALAARIDMLNPAAPAETGLSGRVDEIAARLGSAEAQLRQLDSSVSENAAALAGQSGSIDAVLQLPLILSSLESAFAGGRPYQTELAALRTALPQASIPPAIANGAGEGLTRPDIIAARFAEVLPAMLAGRPADPNADWQEGALDWFRGAIALRPTGESAGDDPEAVMSRLEAAIARRDFASAETLFVSLPAPMQAAAGAVPSLVEAQAEAARFLTALRQEVLSGGVRP